MPFSTTEEFQAAQEAGRQFQREQTQRYEAEQRRKLEDQQAIQQAWAARRNELQAMDALVQAERTQVANVVADSGAELEVRIAAATKLAGLHLLCHETSKALAAHVASQPMAVVR